MILRTQLDRQHRPPRSLDRLYDLPNETISIDDWYRLRNLDLPHLDDLELDRERFRLSARIAYEPDWSRRSWLAERRAAVLAEQQRRSRGGR